MDKPKFYNIIYKPWYLTEFDDIKYNELDDLEEDELEYLDVTYWDQLRRELEYSNWHYWFFTTF